MMAAVGETVEVHSLKYDRSLNRKWSLVLSNVDDNMIIANGVFEDSIDHPELGLIQSGTTTIEYFWKDRWFNVFEFTTSNRDFRCFYCNLSSPVEFTDNVITYVDFDIDVVVEMDFSVRVLDEAEFEENSRLYTYSPQVMVEVQSGKKQLIGMISDRVFPFAEKNSGPLGYS